MVLPLPKKPVKTVTGTRTSLFAIEDIYFLVSLFNLGYCKGMKLQRCFSCALLSVENNKKACFDDARTPPENPLYNNQHNKKKKKKV